MTKIKQLIKSGLFKETVLYGLTNALFTGLPLILMPFLVAVMSPEDYGIVDLFKSISLVLTPILGLSTVQSITRFYYDLEDNSFKIFCSSVIILHFVTAIIGISIIALISLFLEEKFIVLSYLSVLFFLFNQITEALLSIYRLKKNTKKYIIIRLGSVVLDLALLGVFYFLYKHYDWTYRVIPNVLSTVIFGFICLILLRRQYGIKFQFNKELLRQSIVYSSPLILHMISGYILNVGDRFLIIHFLGTKELGNYSVAYQLGMSVSFFYTSFNLAWTPTFFEWMKEGKYKAINRVKKLVFLTLPIIGVFILVGWIILSKYISNFNKYHVELNLVVLIVIAYVLLSFYKFNANYFFYFKNTKKLAVITLTTAIISIISNIILIPIYGILGAAITTLITFIIMYGCVANIKTIPHDQDAETNNKGN